jgi:peptidoglycan/LPS O-acetylase OafA/YrhL
MVGNWMNVAMSALIVCALYHASPAGRWRGIDKAVGDYSYPIYLVHLQMGIVAAALLFGSPVTGRSARSAAVFALGLAFSLAVGAVCARLIDPVTERLRTRIKPRSA